MDWALHQAINLLLLLLSIDISFMKGICTYVPETNHVPTK